MSDVSGPENDHNSSSPTKQPTETIQGAPQTPPILPVPVPQKPPSAILTDTLILPDGRPEKDDAALLHAGSVMTPAPGAPSDGAPPVAPALNTELESAKAANAAAPLAEGVAPDPTSPQPAKPQTATQEMLAVPADTGPAEPAPEDLLAAPAAETPAPTPDSEARKVEPAATPHEVLLPSPRGALPAPDAPLAAEMDGASPENAPPAGGASSSSAATDAAPAPRVTKPFPDLAAGAPLEPVEPVEPEPSAPGVTTTRSTRQLSESGTAPSEATPAPPPGASPGSAAAVPGPQAPVSVDRAESASAALPGGEALTATAASTPASAPGAAQPPAPPASHAAPGTPAPVSAAGLTTGEATTAELRACPVCGSRVREGELACSFCGHVLSQQGRTNKFDEETEVSGQKRYPTGEVLTTEQKPITFEIEGKQLMLLIAESITVGRNSDIPGDALPDVDLGPYGASESGVSRRHIRIRRKGILLYVADLNSTNGTLLNGRKLIPEGERLIRSGDELRLGHLKIRVKF